MSEDSESDINVSSPVSAVTDLVKAAGDSDEGKQAAKNIGTAAVTITELMNNCLLPIAAINYGVKKAKVYFETRFDSDLSLVLGDVDEGDLCEPQPYIAASVLQSLAFSHEELDLKEMYLNLLASSMDSSKSLGVHPAFVEVVKQLTPAEANSFKELFTGKAFVPMVSLKTSGGDLNDYSRTMFKYLVDVEVDKPIVKLSVQATAIVDNWLRLGLTHPIENAVIPEHEFEWVYSRTEYVELKRFAEKKGRKVEVLKHSLALTDFGVNFCNAVGISIDK